MQRHRIRHVLLSLTLTMIAWGAVPHACSAQDNQIAWWVVGSGGVIDAGDGIFLCSATVGQAIIGPGGDGMYIIDQGFWVPNAKPASVEIATRTTSAFGLRNYPNPFSTTTTIAYQLDGPGEVNLEITDLLGAPVVTLVEEIQNGGDHSVMWDGMTARGARAGGGMYIYLLTVRPTGSDAHNVRTEQHKLMLIR